MDGATNNIGSTRGDNNNFFRFVSFDLALIRELTPELDSLGNIRPYLESACKLYSEADAGPGAEAGAGFRDYKNSFGSICVAASVRPGSGRVHEHTTLGSRPAPGTPSAKRSVGHVEQPVS